MAASSYFQQSTPPPSFVNFYSAHHHHHLTQQSVTHQQNSNSVPPRLNGASFVESSVNEMIFEQLELSKRETERIIVRPCTAPPSTVDGVPMFPGAGLDPPPGVEKIVPTYRATLARRNILVKEKIGSGSYSKVRLAFRLSNNLVDLTQQQPTDELKLETVAVKIVDRRRAPKDYQTRFMPRELDIWATLRHPNVVRLHETFSDQLGRFVFMVSEYLEGGDCLRYVQRIGSLNEPTACHWVAQLCCGVRYMHAKGVCHRDLKLENLFLESDGSHIKIGDLGFARRFSNSAKELSQTYCGSKSYAAPEILKGVPHDAKKSDVWAIGVIAYILLTGKMPFDESQSNRRIIEDQRRLAVLHWDRFPQISATSRAFVDHALTFPYTKRPAVSGLLRHDWLMPHRSMIVELEQTFSHPRQAKQTLQPQQQQFSASTPLFNSSNAGTISNNNTRNGFYPMTSSGENGSSSVILPSPILYHNHHHQAPNSMVCDTSDPMVVCSPPSSFLQSKQQNNPSQQGNNTMVATSSSSSGGASTGTGSSNGGGGSGSGSGGSGAPFAPFRRAFMVTSSGGTSASTSSSAATGSGLMLMAGGAEIFIDASKRIFGTNTNNNHRSATLNMNVAKFEQLQQQLQRNHHHSGRYQLQFGFQSGN